MAEKRIICIQLKRTDDKSRYWEFEFSEWYEVSNFMELLEKRSTEKLYLQCRIWTRTE